MVQHLLEFMDETGCAWPAMGSAQSGAGSGKAPVSVWQRGAFAIWRSDRGGRVGKQMGKKVLWNTCMVRSGTSGVGEVSLQWILTIFCRLAGGTGTCWVLKAGQGIQLCSGNKPPQQHLQFISSPGCCLAGTWSSKLEPAHHLLASQTITGLLGGICRSPQLPPTQTTG